MKPILLVLDQNVEKAKEFDTVKEAQEAVAKQGIENFGFVDIYTLYASAKFEVKWELATDTGANLRENKKAEVKQQPRKGEWTNLEIDTLETAVKSGTMTASDIAEKLKRPTHSITSKMYNLGLKFSDYRKTKPAVAPHSYPTTKESYSE